MPEDAVTSASASSVYTPAPGAKRGPTDWGVRGAAGVPKSLDRPPVLYTFAAGMVAGEIPARMACYRPEKHPQQNPLGRVAGSIPAPWPWCHVDGVKEGRAKVVRC